MTFDMDRPWQLSATVSLRPESFGALMYNFHTRRLTFLKTRTLLDLIRALGEHATGREACLAVGVPGGEIRAYEAALGTLASSGMIVERES